MINAARAASCPAGYMDVGLDSAASSCPGGYMDTGVVVVDGACPGGYMNVEVQVTTNGSCPGGYMPVGGVGASNPSVDVVDDGKGGGILQCTGTP